METMSALWPENKKLEYRNDIPVPTIENGEALVRVRLAGICSTDLELVRGYYPFLGVLGHEFIGEVINAPDKPSWNGARVVGMINTSCGLCRNCLEGRITHCDHRTVLWIKERNGVFAEFMTLPIENLLCVPDIINDDKAVFTEPLAASLKILEQIPIKQADRVFIVGAGRVGQLIAQTVAITC
jgi:threonine dehydrogenase-like Zn-dependent dehydrogenase